MTLETAITILQGRQQHNKEMLKKFQGDFDHPLALENEAIDIILGTNDYDSYDILDECCCGGNSQSVSFKEFMQQNN